MAGELADTTFYFNAGGRGSRLNGEPPYHPVYGTAKALLEVGTPPLQLIEHHLNRAFAEGAAQVMVGCGDQAGYIAGRYSGRCRIDGGSSSVRLGTGNAVYFRKGWKRSPGAQAEHRTALRLGLPITYLEY